LYFGSLFAEGTASWVVELDFGTGFLSSPLNRMSIHVFALSTRAALSKKLAERATQADI
jgi:hypothetical protein